MRAELTYAPVFTDGDLRAEIVARIDGEPVARQKVNLSSDVSRSRFSRAVMTAVNSASPDEIETELLLIADKVQSERDRQERATHNGSKPEPVPGAVKKVTLDEARKVFAKWIKLDDWTVLDVILGTVMVHRIEGDPLWLFLVGPPGAIKTELLRALAHHPAIYSVSTLSPNAMISGYVTDGPDPSLLPKLDGKVLVVKDFTTILQMQRDARQEVISMLRDVYDGEAAKVFGTGETKSYQSRFGLIAAVTPVIDDYSSINAMLGERFLRFRLEPGGNLEKIGKALDNTAAENSMRTELSEAALGVLAQESVKPEFPEWATERIKHLANFLATARSEVSRDRSGAVTYEPVPEVGTRVAKQLKKTALGLAMVRTLGVVDDDIYRIVTRIALDSLPSMRRRLLRQLWRTRELFETTQDIADPCELDTDTCRRWLADLRLLGIVERRIEARNAHAWRLRDSFVADIRAAQIWPAEERIPTPPDSAPHGGEHGEPTVGCEVGEGPQDLGFLDTDPVPLGEAGDKDS